MNKLGCLYFHDYDSRKNYPGFPDTVIIRGDTLVFAELKIDGAYASKNQKQWLNALADVRYMDVGLWHASGLQGITDYLTSVGNGEVGRLPMPGQWHGRI